MTTYSTPQGDEITVCDGCGIAEDGSRPDVSTFTALNLDDGLHQYLRKAGAEKLEHFCPACGPHQKGATQLP